MVTPPRGNGISLDRADHSKAAPPPAQGRIGTARRSAFLRRHRWTLAGVVVVLVAGSLAVAHSGGSDHHPLGVPGAWHEVWGDEFDGTSLDRTRWSTEDGQVMNNVTAHASNVRVAGGNLILTLSSPTSGAFVSSLPAGKKLPNGYQVPAGGYVEARVLFPGSESTIDNWPAWWVSGFQDWPSAGEHDIAEGLGTLTVNYHSRSGAHNTGTVAGTWSNHFHVYGLYRGKHHADVYWDGTLVRSYPTDDTGGGQSIAFNVGAGGPQGEDNGSRPVYGTESQVRVDYVRAFSPSD